MKTNPVEVKNLTPFDQLSFETLLFLEEKTRDQEPWNGWGFATQVHIELLEALDRKRKELDAK